MITVGVISDIHSHKWGDDILQGGYYYPNMPDKPISQNPFASLKELFRKENRKFDFIVSPGDFAHQIDPEGLKSSWEQLKLIKNEVDAEMLIATIGNHDVASRENGDVFKYIKEFDIDFPVYSSTKSQEYKNQLLENGYYYIDDEKRNVLILVINSCFDHWDKVEASKGKIDTESLAEIKAITEKSGRDIKIALLHHHPIVHETGIYDTNDIIEGGEPLMESLAEMDLIIHGHKHDYRFTQQSIYPKNLNILSSGSFSCFKTYLKSGTLNYFHEIEFHMDNVDHCYKHGLIKTYAYDPTSGWNRYKELDEGFGCTLEGQSLYDYVEKAILSITGSNYVEYSELLDTYPTLNYIARESRNSTLDSLIDKKIIARYNKNNDGIGDIIIK